MWFWDNLKCFLLYTACCADIFSLWFIYTFLAFLFKNSPKAWNDVLCLKSTLVNTSDIVTMYSLNLTLKPEIRLMFVGEICLFIWLNLYSMVCQALTSENTIFMNVSTLFPLWDNIWPLTSVNLSMCISAEARGQYSQRNIRLGHVFNCYYLHYQRLCDDWSLSLYLSICLFVCRFGLKFLRNLHVCIIEKL